MSQDSGQQLDGQSLTDHLRELRSRLVNCLIALVVLTIAAYVFIEPIFNFVRAPIAKYLTNGGLIYTGPMDKFIAHIKLAFVCGVILSCPVWLHQIWEFIAPGLYKNEKKYTLGFLFSGTVLFLLGVAFGYYVALPAAFEFLFNYGGSVDKPMISIDQYLSFFSQICLAFGISFELPVVIVVLGMMGLVSQEFLRANRRYAIFTIAVIAAVITPPDLMSMVFMLVPMVVLFELGVFLVGVFERKNAESQE